MGDIAQRIVARLSPRIDKKAWEPDEPYPSSEQERRMYEEGGCVGPDGTGCPKDNLADDMNTRLCEECDAAVEITAMEEILPWDEIEESCPNMYAHINAEFQELERKADGRRVRLETLSDYPEIINGIEKLKRCLNITPGN